ncbi:MAG: class I SAM-dependent methyltransferase [Candidatus Aminicenantes bacterium]|nr:class I SAM-dependent methyltransferase [Candidatus Aminicenantes bacterium]
MLEWPRYSVYKTPEYLELRKKIRNPGPGRPKAWAYPWCILNGQLHEHLFSLDFGCGSKSNFTYYISEITKSMTIGADLSRLQEDSGSVRFVQNRIDRLEFPDDFFDRIFSISVLEHVPLNKRAEVLTEIFRVLRPGGLAVFTIDWIFGMNDRLLEQLIASRDLGRIGSNIFGNYDFSRLISDYEHLISPLLPINEKYLPGSAAFDEERILADEDMLVSESDNVTDVELFKYTTVGLILKKQGKADCVRTL